MESKINLSTESVGFVSNREMTRVPWEDKHSELIAKLQAEYNSPQEEDTSSSTTRYQQFCVNDLNLLASEQHAPEILDDNIVYPLMLTPEWVLGTSNVRGKIVPIFDLEKILYPEVCSTKPKNYKTLVLHEGENTVGLPLFQLPVLIYLDKEECVAECSKLPGSIKPFVKKIYMRKDKVWILIDFSSLFSFLKSKYIHS